VELNYTNQGRRPSVGQIIADWKRGGKPTRFTVEYGETFARFEFHHVRWYADGNGCRGVDRDKVEKKLNELTAGIEPTASW